MTESLIGTNYRFIDTKTGQKTTAFFDCDRSYKLQRVTHFMKDREIIEECKDMDTFSGEEAAGLTKLRDRLYREEIEAIHPLTNLSSLINRLGK